MKNVWLRLKKFSSTTVKTLDGLKYNKRAVYWIMAIDLALGISSTVVDWPWLIRVPPNLVAFAPICSLYPWLLIVWFALYLRKPKEGRARVPAWFTSFLFVGLFGYGILAWIYYPFYMSWTGINFHDVASIFWVTMYAGQAFIIASEIKKSPWYQFALIMGYFYFKDVSDRYFGTFLDVLLDSYPEYLKLLMFASALSLHSMAAGVLIFLQGKKAAYGEDIPVVSNPGLSE